MTVSEMGRLGGKARAAKLTKEEIAAISSKAGKVGGKAKLVTLSPERRREIARNAINARWAKYRAEKEIKADADEAI